MQTGEGKTLAAVPAIVVYAKSGEGVHVMTVNDYLARRDAKWMGGIYEFLGLTVGCVQQGMNVEERSAPMPATSPTPRPTRSASTISATNSPCSREPGASPLRRRGHR